MIPIRIETGTNHIKNPCPKDLYFLSILSNLIACLHNNFIGKNFEKFKSYFYLIFVILKRADNVLALLLTRLI